ncbi:stromal cell-derived factor 2 [Plodia interpunctella]|uniref:stromal cell-derived factor 2 n=1 Tax=Plodia interpunctella TaxID=58824 RepID=UPI002367A3A5|nr:stromal cell-derived factor 2 [Plodia interpunctella]
MGFQRILFNLLGVVPVILLICYFQASQASKAEYVTCGTILKLINTDLKLRLHSHDVKYGSGSGQQSVTAVDVSDDHNSHWQVKAATGEDCKRGSPIKCNSVIRLQHVGTKKNLHSHYFTSPLSSNQEVSCYGDDDGLGDSGDHWTVICNNDFWRRDTPVKLRHVDTAAYLAGSGRTFGRPISGQGEVVGVNSQYGSYTDWQAKEGLFVHPSDPLPHQHAIHSEL